MSKYGRHLAVLSKVVLSISSRTYHHDHLILRLSFRNLHDHVDHYNDRYNLHRLLDGRLYDHLVDRNYLVCHNGRSLDRLRDHCDHIGRIPDRLRDRCDRTDRSHPDHDHYCHGGRNHNRDYHAGRLKNVEKLIKTLSSDKKNEGTSFIRAPIILIPISTTITC